MTGPLPAGPDVPATQLPPPEALWPLLAGSPDGVAVVGPEGTVLFANPAAERMLRPPGAPLLGGGFGPPLSDAGTGTGAEAGTGATTDLDGAVFEVPATGRSVEIRVVPLQWEGRTVRLVNLRDVTERRRADLSKELAEQRFRVAAEIMLDGLFVGTAIHDDTGAIVDFRCDHLNRAACRIFGVEREQLVGHPMSELFPGYGESRLFTDAVQVVESGTPASAQDVRYDGALAGRGFAARSFDVSIAPSGDGVITVFRDVTLRSHTAEELERRVEERTIELTAANTELATFSYSVSHDLRAPLRAIEGFSQIVLRDQHDRLDPAGRHALERVVAGVARMNELIEALLGLSRVSSHPIEPQVLDLGALATEVAGELSARPADAEQTLTVQPSLSAYGDPHLLRVLMTNLLGNAYKFTAGRSSPRIEVGSRDSDIGETIFYVRDNGAGFDMAHAERLFRPFERLHRQSDFSGTGVGLATVQRIVRRHGGRVWAEAAVDEGATFFFTLGPASGSASALLRWPAPPAPPAGHRPPPAAHRAPGAWRLAPGSRWLGLRLGLRPGPGPGQERQADRDRGPAAPCW